MDALSATVSLGMVMQKMGRNKKKRPPRERKGPAEQGKCSECRASGTVWPSLTSGALYCQPCWGAYEAAHPRKPAPSQEEKEEAAKTALRQQRDERRLRLAQQAKAKELKVVVQQKRQHEQDVERQREKKANSKPQAVTMEAKVLQRLMGTFQAAVAQAELGSAGK